MQISPPITHESPSSSNTNAPLFLDGLAGKGSGGQTSDNDGFVRSNNTKSTLHADLPAAARLDTTDEHGAELSFAQLLLDDTTTEPTVDFQQQQETLIVEDQLPTDLQSELPSHFSNVLPLSNREVSDEIGKASQPNLPQAPVGPSGAPLLPITQQVNTTAALNEAEISETSQTNLPQAPVGPPGVPLPPITQQANTTAALNETEISETSPPNLSQALVDPAGVPLPPITQQADTTAALNKTEIGEALVDPAGVLLPPITQQADTTAALNETEIGEASQPNLPQALVDPAGVPLPPITQQANTAVALTETEGTLTESTQSQLTPQEAETNSAANLSDTVLFDRPSFVTASTPQLEPPTLPAVPASHQAVTENVVDTIVEQAQLTEVGESKQLTLQLHPAELGQVTLLVDWEVDSLKVKIVANELAANEILNQNKSELIAALAEEGIDFDSLDVSYGNAQSELQDHNKNSRSQQLAPELFASPAEPETETTETTNPNRSSNLDITI